MSKNKVSHKMNRLKAVLSDNYYEMVEELVLKKEEEQNPISIEELKKIGERYSIKRNRKMSDQEAIGVIKGLCKLYGDNSNQVVLGKDLCSMLRTCYDALSERIEREGNDDSEEVRVKLSCPHCGQPMIFDRNSVEHNIKQSEKKLNYYNNMLYNKELNNVEREFYYHKKNEIKRYIAKMKSNLEFIDSFGEDCENDMLKDVDVRKYS